jgi:hypothetical protein
MRSCLQGLGVHLFYRVSLRQLFGHGGALHGVKYPNLAFYVRELVIWPPRLHVDQVSELLPLSPRLCKLTLHANWMFLAPGNRNALHRILDLPILTHLKLSCVTFNVLEEFEDLIRPHLKRLTVVLILGPWDDEPQVSSHSSHAIGEKIKQDVMSERQSCRLEHLRPIITLDFWTGS